MINNFVSINNNTANKNSNIIISVGQGVPAPSSVRAKVLGLSSHAPSPTLPNLCRHQNLPSFSVCSVRSQHFIKVHLVMRCCRQNGARQGASGRTVFVGYGEVMCLDLSKETQRFPPTATGSSLEGGFRVGYTH